MYKITGDYLKKQHYDTLFNETNQTIGRTKIVKKTFDTFGTKDLFSSIFEMRSYYTLEKGTFTYLDTIEVEGEVQEGKALRLYKIDGVFLEDPITLIKNNNESLINPDILSIEPIHYVYQKADVEHPFASFIGERERSTFLLIRVNEADKIEKTLHFLNEECFLMNRYLLNRDKFGVVQSIELEDYTTIAERGEG